jgi:hypothetical protein
MLIRTLLASAVLLALSISAALAQGEGVWRVAVKPGGFVEIAVIGDERVLAMELVAPDGRRIRSISMAQDKVYERQGPSGPYFADRPAYIYRPSLGFGYRDPFWDPWPYRHDYRDGLWGRGTFFGPRWPVPVPRSKAYSLSTGRILVGDTALFRQTWPDWRLRLAYGDGRVVELRVPSVEYQG